ncbi:hypothetical protein FTUN_3998 [Frigoriglobus tundricola]|uniref:Uncharacterized protein n=1 Tax=Frigoriglobus tundricola TaxID=2774151 RepID=A0A6M5YT37_9BACT|nr:hypothetical protein FTUN_3998 [Frigoriglobus tundricola]
MSEQDGRPRGRLRRAARAAGGGHGLRGQPPRSVDHAEVSGKVLLQGKPVPGGQVSFVAVNGGFAASGNIDENGIYQIKAPVGEVKITVTNSMLQARKGAGARARRRRNSSRTRSNRGRKSRTRKRSGSVSPPAIRTRTRPI